MGIQIISTGSCLPELTVTNDDLSKFLDTSDEWISTRTGIKTRHIATSETTTDLGVGAARQALERSNLRPDEIDLVICSTVTPDTCVPMVASSIAKALGIERTAAFDLNANCSSFVYAVTTAYSLMTTCGYRNAIVVGSDTNSQIADWTDRSTCVLFGDGAGAVVLSNTERRGILSTSLSGVIDKDNFLSCANPLSATPFFTNLTERYTKVSMYGRGVMRFAIGAFEEALKTVTEKAGVAMETISMIVPHQANIRIIKSSAKKMGIGEEKIYMNIDKVANTSSASIPVALHEAVQKQLLHAGDLILLIAFGGGLSSGAVLLEW